MSRLGFCGELGASNGSRTGRREKHAAGTSGDPRQGRLRIPARGRYCVL